MWAAERTLAAERASCPSFAQLIELILPSLDEQDQLTRTHAAFVFFGIGELDTSAPLTPPKGASRQPISPAAVGGALSGSRQPPKTHGPGTPPSGVVRYPFESPFAMR